MSELISLCGLGVGGTCVAASPAGDPSAYLIRGAVVALRARDAAGIRVEPATAFCPASAGEEPRWA